MASENKFGVLILVSLLVFAPAISGEISSQRRLLFFFDKIEVNGEVDVFLNKGKRNREATIYADSEVIDSVLTRVSKRTLYVDANNTYRLARRLPFVKLNAQRKFPVEIMISIDKLTEIRVLGGSNLTSEGLNSDKLSVFCSSTGKIHLENLLSPALHLRHEGSGTVVLRGKGVNRLEAQILGNGLLRAEEFTIGEATLLHQGKEDVHLAPLRWLDARMRGPGNLMLHRKPEKMVIDQAGEGIVRDIISGPLPFLDLNASTPKLGEKY
jgi:hypothetical protein